ncbi:uncharacterized protein LOC114358573 [Ostrinia furnacalis]|uniref:uncharacterized protein LOC114358573 n=1 Tax=Ostrinia furnacalis TaxID=93504 RepID=UPI0010397BC1|nr:uncharacterized protein LOC114358573 [Ostrinia furnacalis]
MKLRNNTRFRINYLHTNLKDLEIRTQLSLHDLHLVGSYERAITDNDPSILYYVPTFGQADAAICLTKVLIHQVVYKYNAQLSNGMPPLNGLMIMTADELTSHMAMQLVKEPETVDLRFDFIRQMKPESLTIEGPANRMIANFKHILEHHIISLMTNALIHNIRSLSTLTRCHPILFGHVDEGQEQETEEEEEKPRPETGLKNTVIIMFHIGCCINIYY